MSCFFTLPIPMNSSSCLDMMICRIGLARICTKLSIGSAFIDTTLIAAAWVRITNADTSFPGTL